MKSLRFFLAALILLITPFSRATESTVIVNEILIWLQPGVDAQAYFGDELPNAEKIGSLPLYRLTIDAPTEAAVLAEVERRQADPRVRIVEANNRAELIFWPNPSLLEPIFRVPPDLILVPVFVVHPGYIPGRYVGTVSVRKNLAAADLSDRYILRVQARAGTDGKITLLTSSDQGPGSATVSGVEPAVSVTMTQPSGSQNCLVDNRFPGELTFTKSGFKLRYSVTPPAAQAATVPIAEYEFTLRKR